MQRTQIMAEFDRHEIPPTTQRIEIAGILLEKPQHLSAEQIIERLRGMGSGVSKATVYNTLNLFVERGLVNECVVDPQRLFYDSNNEPHHHFFNVDTGKLTDIPHDSISLQALPAFPQDEYLEGVEILVKLRNGRPKRFA